MHETISSKQARRLALRQQGLLKPNAFGKGKKAAQKALLDSITRQYETLRNDATRFILNDPSHKVPYEQRSGERYEKLSEIYWGLPNYPHQVREKHYACGS